MKGKDIITELPVASYTPKEMLLKLTTLETKLKIVEEKLREKTEECTRWERRIKVLEGRQHIAVEILSGKS